MDKEHWVDITIDISRLEECKETIKDVLDTVALFSVIDLPIELCNAYWALSNAIKWLKVLNGDDHDDLHRMSKRDLCDIRQSQRQSDLRLLRRQTPEGEIQKER
jgi:hypothetical protein